MAADPLDQIAELCQLQPEGVLDKIAAVLGMDKVEAQRDELRAALVALAAEADHFKFVVLKPQIYTDECTKHRAPRYLAALDAASKLLRAAGVGEAHRGSCGVYDASGYSDNRCTCGVNPSHGTQPKGGA